MSEVKVHVDISNALQNSIKDLNNEATMLAIHNTLAKMCDPYVPYLYGPLSETIQVSANGVRYTQPYARRQYFGDSFNHTREKHPLASARWDEAMMRDHGDEFVQEVTQILERRVMENGINR